MTNEKEINAMNEQYYIIRADRAGRKYGTG